MIAGMPHPQRARARTIYRQGKAEAVAEVEELLYCSEYLHDPARLIGKIGEWVKKTKGIISD